MIEDARALIQELVEIARRAHAADIRAYEEPRSPDAVAELVSQVQGLLAAGVDTVSRVLARYEAKAPHRSPRQSDEPPASFFISVDHLFDGDMGARQIADLAFVARMELRSRTSALGGIRAAQDSWRILGICDGCLRALRKTAAAIEKALAERHGLAPRLHFTTEIALGRRIRHYYARFRREIHGAQPPEPEDLRARLNSAATSIAKLIGRDFYGDLRTDDRAQLRSLQRRLRSWLRGEDGYDAETGTVLWQDLHGFAQLLAHINQRSELVEHDRALVAEAVEALFATSPTPATLPEELAERLRALSGRDDEVDRLLAEPITRETEAWRRPLLHLREELVGGAPAVWDADPGEAAESDEMEEEG